MNRWDVKIETINKYWVNDILAEDEDEAIRRAHQLMEKNGKEDYFDDSEGKEEAWETT